MTLFRCVAFFLALAAAATGARGAVITLYDAAVTQLPQEQGWLDLVTTNGATADLVPVGTHINTGIGGTSPEDEAGWFSKLPGLFGTYAVVNPQFPVLDSTVGFTLAFELQIHAETHVGDHRAGFSVILLDENALGVEIGFWEDQVWAQGDSPLFARAESQSMDTTADRVLYELTISGADYLLTGDGNPLLNGPLRDYSGYLTNPYITDPYEIPGFLFLGDDTDSAFADVTLGSVRLRIPLPPVWTLLLPGLFLAGVPRKVFQITAEFRSFCMASVRHSKTVLG